MENSLAITEDSLKSKIYTIRGLQVMLDSDLANLYEIETKALNKAVNRNIERFPKDFMFQLTMFEFDYLRSQIATSDIDNLLRFQNGTLEIGRGKHRKYLPYAFTEQGVATLSGVLKSKKAVEVNIEIMRAFVSMRKFILSNAQIFQRLDNLEIKNIEYDKKFEQVFNTIEEKEIKPEKGIFYDGQIFDSYKFVSKIIRSANKSIILIDNYVDESVLTLFSKRKEGINVTIFTKSISKELKLDLDKYNSQYSSISVKEFNSSHDRFMIIDNKEVYHIGASLKDLGKKWFGFSRFDKEAFGMIGRLEE